MKHVALCRKCDQLVRIEDAAAIYVSRVNGTAKCYCKSCYRIYRKGYTSQIRGKKIRKRKQVHHQETYNYLTLTRLVDVKFESCVNGIISGKFLLFPVAFLSRHTLNEYLIAVTPICTDGKAEAVK